MLLGDPKRAIVQLSIPMIIGMSVHTIYNLVDAIWVAGLGSDALAAVGFVFPIFFMLMGIATGLGTGGGAAISRMIGAKDKNGADSVAVHTIVIMLILVVVFTIPLYLFSEGIFTGMRAGSATEMSVSYARVIFAGTIFVLFSNIANALLRAEGDAKRAMQAMVLGTFLNIALDPIMIYTLEMGVAGAAWATVISLAITSILMANWLIFKNDTYVSLNFNKFRFDRDIVIDILRVGFPASVMQLSMAFTMLIMNLIIVMVDSTDGVAIYTTGWRVVTIAILPLLGMSTAVVSVSGAAFGAKTYEKLNVVHLYSIRIGLIIEATIAIATFLLAPQITAIFTQAEGAAHIAPDLITFLRIITLFYPGVAFGMMSSSLFQGIGKGMYALVATVLRSLILTPLFAILFGFVFESGLPGMWWSLVIANLSGSMVAFLWARYHLGGLLKDQNFESSA
ncbi:MAG: MATE family efflux transporter [Halobacteriota archaeon]|nr:MATE family efflux transporter [Halobacteriota archaeon]